MSRATDAALDALHSLAAASMTEELRRGLERAREPKTIRVEDKDVPNPAYEPLSPKVLAVAIKFLKDNGIDAPASAVRFTGIVDELRNLNVDDPNFMAN
jgi:hypothetical protein